ncbi:MAG: hypothetical protein FJX72_11700 [Armatimonadetes bacterium]|nr:hypothetical protein [Armatimonadota bacterium]
MGPGRERSGAVAFAPAFIVISTGSPSGRCLRCGLVAALAASASTAIPSHAAAESPGVREIIRQYVEARHSANLRGLLLSVQPTPQAVRTCSRRVVRRSDGRSLSVFESPANERGAVIADDGTWVIRYDPRGKIVRKKRSFQSGDARGVDRLVRLILRNYEVRMEGDEAVAGRSCRRVLMEPARPRNLTVRLWIDKATGVEMRRDEQDASGSTISIVMYTSVEFPSSISLSEVTPKIPKSARTVNIARSSILTGASALGKAAGFAVRMPLTLPWGYEFDRGTVVEIGGRKSGFLRYVDGLSELTVIETRVSPRASPGLRAARVIPRPYGEVEVDYALDDLQVVVAGRGDARELIAVVETLGKAREDAWRSAMSRTFDGRAAAVSAMRDRGLTAEAIVALLTISVGSGRSPRALLDSYVEGWGWQDLARRWRVPESEVHRRLNMVVGGK